MSVSPSFAEWPPGGVVVLPSVADDALVPKPGVGVSAYFLSTDGVLKLKLTDGTMVTVGPTSGGGVGASGVASCLGLQSTIFGTLITSVERLAEGVYKVHTTDTLNVNNSAITLGIERDRNAPASNRMVINYDLNGVTLGVNITIVDETGAAKDCAFGIAIWFNP